MQRIRIGAKTMSKYRLLLKVSRHFCISTRRNIIWYIPTQFKVLREDAEEDTAAYDLVSGSFSKAKAGSTSSPVGKVFGKHEEHEP